jgi:hypothetical protein
MSSYPQPFTTAYVAGSFNGFSPDANPMSDDENDGVWTATIALPTGQNEFKFQLDRWNAQEFFPGSKSCTVINGDSTNRIIIVEGATMVLPTVCFNSCNGCNQEDQVSITFNVGTSNITVADGGLFIAGGGNFGDPGENQLTDDDGDGVYSITFFREAGFTSFYAFANGNCPDFSCKENITGQACANPDNSNDRFLAPVISNTIINTCYGICTDNTECGAPLERSEVTFTLNMNEYTEPFTTAYVAGSFNNWSADANPMSDDDGDGIYTATISINPGPFEFKYQLDMWTVEELFMGGESCTVTNGGLTNRTFTVVEATEVLPSFCFNSCNDCAVGTLDLAIYGINFELYPTVVNQELVLNLGQKTAQQSTVQIVTAEGKLVQTLKLIGEQRQQLNVSQLPAGVYFVRLQHRDAMGVRRFVKP